MSFSLDVSKFAEKIGVDFKAVRDKIAIQLLTGITLDTPVDTGRARANWQVTTGGPAEKVVDAMEPSGAATIAKGTTEIVGIDESGSIFITNNLPYIRKLENGSSMQAPAGMVAKNIASVQAYMDEAVGGIDD